MGWRKEEGLVLGKDGRQMIKKGILDLLPVIERGHQSLMHLWENQAIILPLLTEAHEHIRRQMKLPYPQRLLSL